MKGKAEVTGPETAFVLGTRAAIGVGLGLLLANRFSDEQRRAIGGTLLLVGVFAGAILVSELFGRPRRYTVEFGTDREGNRSSLESENRLHRETLMAGD
jgi:hypothetical protein